MSKRKYKLKPIEAGTAFEGLFSDCEELETLPLTHKKDWYVARSILKNGAIPLEDCDVFCERLQYFFYGRPAYAVAQGKGNRKDNLYFPVCFLIDPTCVEIDSVFPFDTGAFADEFYDDYIHEDMDINKFLISPTLQTIKGFINYFYGDNEKYYTRKQKNIVTSYDTIDELRAYISIMTASGAPSFDERAETIEVITRSPLSLHAGVKAMVIPNEFACASDTIDAIEELKANGVDIITYRVIGLSPEQYNAIVHEKVYEYLLSKDLFSKHVTKR